MRPLFRIEKFVEMIVALVHARRRDAFGFLVRQFRGLEAAAHALELAQLFVFMRRDEISGERAVARNRNRLALRLHLVAAEVAGELGGRNGVSHVHASLSFTMRIIRAFREECNIRALRRLRDA